MTRFNPPSNALDAEALSAAEAKAALAFIEAHLFEPMSVTTIAASCGLSPSQFSRAFTRRQGESVMAYVRGRRLEGTMRRLIDEPRTRIIDLAFDAGFDSQEAFTRAFVRAFGETPGRFQRAGATTRLRRRRRSRMAKPTIHESIERRNALRMAGLSQRFTPATTVEMGALWQRFVPLIGFDGRLGDGETYGVWVRRHPNDGSFDFFAGVPIAAACTPPKPLEMLTIPACTYLVYRQMLTEGELHPQTLVATDVIWSELAPASGRRVAAAPDFQVYPANFKVAEGWWIDHFLPLED